MRSLLVLTTKSWFYILEKPFKKHNTEAFTMKNSTFSFIKRNKKSV